MAETIEQRANQWIAGRDTGASSKALWAVMMGSKPERHAYPSDGGDLGRCMRLLDAVPEWKPRIGEMAAISPYWAALVAEWPKLERLHAADDHKATYAAMKAILNPIEDKDPGIIRLGGGMSMRFGR